MVFLVNMNVAGYLPESEPYEFSDSEIREAIRAFKEMMTESETTDGHMSDFDIHAEGEGALTAFARGQTRYAHNCNGVEFFISKES